MDKEVCFKFEDAVEKISRELLDEVFYEELLVRMMVRTDKHREAVDMQVNVSEHYRKTFFYILTSR